MYFEMMQLFLAGIILNFIFFFYIEKITNFVNIFDEPDNNLKKHKSKVPLLGGLIIASNIIFFILINFFLDYDFINIKISLRSYFSILFFITSFFLLGILDDRYKLKPEKKFILSILFSLFVLSLNNDLLVTKLSFPIIILVIIFRKFKNYKYV